MQVETIKKPISNKLSQKNTNSVWVNKLDNETEAFRLNHVSHSLKTAIMQARQKANLTQQQLATKIAQKVTVVQDYESGKALPVPSMINTLNRVLKVKLPRA